MTPRLLPALLLLLGAGCDHGLAPPAEPARGAVRGVVRYEGRWPPADSLRDLRFVAFRFVPHDTSDFLRLNEFVFSDPLRRGEGVARDSFLIDSVEAGAFPYSGVAQKFGARLLDWRPVGLLDGAFTVRPGETTEVVIDVDFGRIPGFPPRQPGIRDRGPG